ncbi:hypothetical protein D0Z07_0381 [Hyphodiscus hymeniophilus]|uniref:Uncharacterized protein n=1 Tax=Hyphodiscus hymeniophilus TaxID=353542 RepID=A0A9P6VRP2_9HELO|nr:hypothetical protein D0Z07_0381 [Hyphodiscus hymeniophilus]
MVPSKEKGNDKLRADTFEVCSEAPDTEMVEAPREVQSAELLELVERDGSDQLDHLFEPSTLSEVASAIELGLESHIPNPADPLLEVTALIALLPSESAGDPLFVPRQVEDAVLLDFWHRTVLPSLSSNVEKWEGLNGAHLFRQGQTERESRPVILVSIDEDSQDVTTSLRKSFSQLFDEPLRSSVVISFEESSVRRSGTRHLPPICEARNTSFQRLPIGGASIGIQGKLDCTATLGGFLLVDRSPHFLTVDHIVPKELANDSTLTITHPSEQEAQGRPPWTAIETFLMTLRNCCDTCHALWEGHHEQAHFYRPVDPLLIQCPTATEFKKLQDELWRAFPAEPLGTMACRSGNRSRPSLESNGQHDAEMDWALVTVDKWAVPLNAHIAETSKGLHFSKILPGARVRSSGRTSGHQYGQINTARSAVRHRNPVRFTQEHSVIKDSNISLQEWISGGIGVDGDSGSWIIDRDTDALYGMAWGRDRFTNPVCLFAPIVDIVADIKEKSGATKVCFPGEEVSTPLPSKAKAFPWHFPKPTPWRSPWKHVP